MSEDRKGAYNRPLTADEQKRVMKTGLVLTIGSMIFMVGLLALVNYDILKLHPKTIDESTLKGFASRVEYALRYQTLLVFWLLFMVMATIYGRITTKALNPLDEKSEQHVLLFKAILTNSFESIVISVFSQLIFVSFASPWAILHYIPLVNIVQFIGRIAFFAGYPLKRAFGYQCTAVPNVLLNVYNMYSLGKFVGLY